MPVSRKPPPVLEPFELASPLKDALDKHDESITESKTTTIEPNFSTRNSSNPIDQDPFNPPMGDTGKVDPTILYQSFAEDSADTISGETAESNSTNEKVSESRATALQNSTFHKYQSSPHVVHNFNTPLRKPPISAMSTPDITDSFNYDPEQYGPYTRLTYPAQPVSRSPTPGVHDLSMTSEKDLSGILVHSADNDSWADSTPQEDLEKESIDEFLETKHFGPAPKGRIRRRRRTKRRVLLTEGNLVTDIDVPSNLVLPWKGEPEMRQTR